MSGYILRHKLKNPDYATDSSHQWFNIIDIFKNNNDINEIHLHGILKDKDSVSTDNIEDLAVTARKTNFKIFGNSTTDNTIAQQEALNGNFLLIEPGSIQEADLTENARQSFKQIPSGSIDTINIADYAITTLKINDDAVTADKVAPDIDLSEKLKDRSIPGDKLDTDLLGVYISENIPNLSSQWDYNHWGIWIQI